MTFCVKEKQVISECISDGFQKVDKNEWTQKCHQSSMKVLSRKFWRVCSCFQVPASWMRTQVTSFRYELRRKKSIVGMSTGFALDLRTVCLHNSPFPRRNLYDSAVEQTTFPPRQEWAVHVWNRLFRFFFEKNWNAKWTKNHISTRIDGIRTPKFVTIVSSRCKELYLWFWFEVLFCGEGRCTFYRHRRSNRRITKIIHHGKRWPNFKISFHGYCHKR